MSDRVHSHRHPHTLAVALVISLSAAMLVTVPLAAPADAAALAVNITRLYDGTAPFEDWSPGDTTTPTPDGLHQPGDDLDGNNGIVRTLDDVRFRVEYSVNPPLPSGDLVLEVELTNGGWKEGWIPGASTCPGGSTFSTNRTLWTCNIGVVTGASGTVAIDMPAVPPASSADGSQLQAQVRLTEDGDPLTTQTADAAITTVSAAPRFEITKARVRDAQVTNNSLGETGLTSRYFVGLHVADPDPRGISALPEPLSVTDHFGVAGAELACLNGLYGSLPFHSDDTPLYPDRSVSTTYSTCTQTGDSLDIQWNINWDRTAPPPTQGSYGSLYSYANNLIAYDLVTAWLPIATVDAADGTPGDGQGQLYAPNAVETTSGGAPAPGTCSTTTWSPDPGTTSTFDPIDISGVSNIGATVEPAADNGACTRYYLNINTTGQKGGPTNGSSVRADQDFLMYQYLYNISSTGPSLPDRVVCDKFDNSRFTINAAPTWGSASGTRVIPASSTIEYGIGAWGASYPGGAKTNDANAWYEQATSDCSDGTATDLGAGQLWAADAEVDWTNSGGSLIDADQINMVRVTVPDPMPAGVYSQILYEFHAKDDLIQGEELRNYSAFVVNASSTWTLSSCTGQNNIARTCTDDLVPPGYGGAYSRWLQVGGETARTSKSALGATTLNAGDTNSWRVYAFAYPGYVAPPGGWSGWTGSTDIVLDDILPEHFNYVLGSAQAWNQTGAVVPIADPQIIPDTPQPGLTTLRWDLGPVPWNGHVRIDFDTKIDVYADSGSYTNYVEVHSAMDADYPFPAFPTGDNWGRRASRAVDVVALSSAVISKTSTTPYIVAGEDTIYTLQFGNPGPDDLEWMDAIDILPYDGDTRGSVITADTFTLSDVSSAVAGLETWVSAIDPAILSALDGFPDDLLWPADPNVTAPGTAQWPCTFADAQAGVGGCPALADVTALRFIGSDPNPSASGPGDSFVAAGEGPFDITVTYNTTIDALVGDTYPNSWMAVFEGLSLPVLSPTDVIPTIPALGVGDLVYIDVDFNGVFNAAYDVPVQGVDIELYEEGDIAGADPPIGTATTDALGRWFIGGLDNGNYWAYFPSSNTDPGGPLEGRSPALGSVADPNTDADDDVDHNTVNLSGIASGLISLGVSDEPIGDGFVPAGYRDVDVNGTLDFAARGGPSIDVQKTVYTGHTSGADCPGTDSATTATGGDVTWCVTVTNDGDTSLTDITLDDADLGLMTGDFTLLSGDPTLMGRGDTATWYVETTESATLDNDVTATGNPSNPFGNDIPGLGDVSDTDNAVINVVDPSISVDKTVYTGHDTGASCAGGELVIVASGSDVTYCFSVTNTGNTHLADVGIDDTDLGIDQTDMTVLSGDPTLVAPSGTVTWYYDDTATADLTNTATTTGNPATPGGADLVGIADVTDTDTAQVEVVAPGIEIQKTVYAGHDSGASCAGGELVTETVGADVTYCFEVTNTGDTHLSTIGITDLDLGIDQTDMTLIAWDSVPLAPGDSGTLYYQTATTADLTNTATTTANPTTAAGTDLTGIADVTDIDTATVNVVDPSVTIDKTVYTGHDSGASCTGSELVWYTTAADQLTYCFEITNTGDTHLSVTTIDDTDLGIDGNDLTLLSGNPILLAPGATTVGYYETNGTGDLLNTVDLTANPITSSGADLTDVANVTDTDTARVDEVAPSIDIQKTVYAGHDSGASCAGGELVTETAGADITYCFEVTNTGDTHLNTLTVTDTDLGIDQTDMTLLAWDSVPLAPGDSGTLYYDDTASADLTNTATATGNPTTAAGTDLTGIADVTDSDTATVDVVAPSISIDKTVYTGHNSGASCAGVNTINTLTGADVTYCFEVTNTGDTHLNTLTVTDTDLGIDQTDMTLLAWDSVPLAPGDSGTLYYETTTTADLLNTATTTGNPVTAGGADLADVADVTDSDTAAVNVVAPSIDIQKTVYAGHDTGASCTGGELVIVASGSDVTYCFSVTNTGDTHLADVGIDDTDLGIDQTDMTVLSGDPTLVAPSGTVTWYYDDTATADLTNTATTTGNPATAGGADLVGIADVTDTDTAQVEVVAPGIEIQKTVYAGHDSGASCAGGELVTETVGADVTYCFEVTNTGDTHLSTIGITDLDLGIDQTDMTLIAWDSVPLAPGDSGTLYYQTATTADLTNTATTTANPTTAAGTDLPDLTDVTDTDTATVDVVAPSIDIQKTVYAGHDSGASCAGSNTINSLTGADATYCFAVTNTGDTHLAGVTVDDTDLGIDQTDMTVLSGDPALVAPGGTVTWYHESATGNDLVNTATTTGDPAAGDGTDLPDLADVSDLDTAGVNVVAPAISIDKTVYAGHDSGASCAGGELVTETAGAPVTYCFAITNTGDTHLDVTLDDTALGIDETDLTILSGTLTTLAPGATTLGYYDTTVAGDLLNTATATGNPVTLGGTDLTGIADVTDTDTAQVDQVAPALSIDKTVYAGHDSGASCAGGELVTETVGADVTYCFEITNTGDTHLSTIGITDLDLGIDQTDMTLIAWDSVPLAPGDSGTLYYQTTTTADLLNTATATANPVTSGGADLPDVADVTDTDTATVNVVAPAIDIQKTVYAGHDSGASCVGAELVTETSGAPVTYCFAITNTGDTHLGTLALLDGDLGIGQTDLTLLSGSLLLLAPGTTTVGYYETTVAGDLLNTVAVAGNPVTALGTDLTDVATVGDTDTARVDEVAPAISIDKTVYAGHDGGASCAGAELATVTSGTDVTYCFTATNTGDTHLANILVDDTDLGIDQGDLTLLSGDPTLVAPGSTVTWYYDGTATADLVNTATTTGDPATAGGADLTGIADVTDNDTAEVDVVAPAVTIDKTVYPGHDAGASCTGDELVWYTTADTALTYCFEITNTGDTHLSLTTIDDTTLGIDGSDLTLLSGNPILLAPGATTTSYYQTNGTGDLTNTVDLTANPVTPTGTDLTDVANVTDNDTAQVDQVAPAITIDKTVYPGHDNGTSCTGGELVTTLSGDDVTYCFTITNTGDTHLNNLTVDDTDLGIDQGDMNLLSGTPALVAPGSTVTWYYDATASTDLTNTATTTGNPATAGGADLTGLTNVTDNDTAAVDVVAPDITIEKTVYAGHDAGASCAGADLAWYTTADTDLTYCFTATNTGDTHLTDVTLDDPALGIDETDLTGVSGNPALLAPGASVSGYYETTGSGDLLNTATTTGNPADGTGADYPALSDVSDSDQAEVDEVAPDIEIQTTVYAGQDGGTSCAGVENLTTAAGHPVTYCFQVTNTGDTHLAGVTVDDPDLGIDQTAMTLVSGNPFLLAPGATATWVYETTNTAALTNTAITTGDPAASDGTDMTGIADVTDSDPAATAISATAISIVKTVTAGTTCPGIDRLPVAPGTTVTYCFQVTNTGLAHLADVTIDDTDLSIDQDDMTPVSGDLTLLAPGASAVLSYQTVTAGDLVNTASATGDPVDGSGTAIPGLTPPSASDDTEVAELATSLTIEKSAYTGHDNGAGCDGDQTVRAAKDTPVSYCFTITNTGTAHLADVTVTDSDLGIDQDDMTVVSGDPNHLAPGASATLVYETVVDGDLVNTATASGTPTDASGTPAAGLTPPTDDDTAEIDQVNPAIDLRKRAITPIVPVSDTAEFEITVTNTGDVGLVDVRISDALVPACARTIGALAVGKTVTYTCEGPVGGTPKMLTNVARATGDIAEPCSADPCVSDEGKATVEVVESVLVLEKRALQNEVSQGGVATYSFTITNPTRLTIEDVRLIDETFPECSREIGTLGALQTVNYTCDVTTPEEAGELVNKAHVSGRLLTRSYTSYASAAIMIITTLPGAPLASVSGGPLAATGANSTTAGSTAALLLVMGFLFMATGRRRRQDTLERD